MIAHIEDRTRRPCGSRSSLAQVVQQHPRIGYVGDHAPIGVEGLLLAAVGVAQEALARVVDLDGAIILGFFPANHLLRTILHCDFACHDIPPLIHLPKTLEAIS
jgi:hypothetical protein